jgi:hypothetical protein
MKLKSLVSLALLLTTFAWGHAEAGPQDKTVSRFRGSFGDLSCYGTQDCLSTSLYVFSNANDSKSKGRSQEESLVYLSYTVYNYCTDTYVANYFGSTTTASVSGNASRLTSSGTFDVYDYVTETTGTANVNLAFDANGVLTSRSVYTTRYNTPDYSYRVHSIATYTSADATGTVMVNGTNVLEGLECSASIGTTNQGTIEFYGR